jgi:hypothetical protein
MGATSTFYDWVDNIDSVRTGLRQAGQGAAVLHRQWHFWLQLQEIRRAGHGLNMTKIRRGVNNRCRAIAGSLRPFAQL